MDKWNGNGIPTFDKDAMSLSFSCDGVPVFQSSNSSIWPLQGMVNELPLPPPKKSGLWFGSSEPSILEFLEPFTGEIRKLGLRNGVEVCSMVFGCICSCM